MDSPRRFSFGNLFDDVMSSLSNLRSDMYEQENNYIIEMDIPNVSREDIKIDFNNGYLAVNVEKRNENNNIDKSYILRERNSNFYSRYFYLGNIDPNKIVATYQDNVLKLSVPKPDNNINKVIDIN